MEDIKSNITIFIEKLCSFLIFIYLLFFIIKCISIAFTNLFSFDGAMNVQVAQNLLKNHLYATSYNGITLFGENIQTGSPVILPVTIFFMLFGEK